MCLIVKSASNPDTPERVCPVHILRSTEMRRVAAHAAGTVLAPHESFRVS